GLVPLSMPCWEMAPSARQAVHIDRKCSCVPIRCPAWPRWSSMVRRKGVHGAQEEAIKKRRTVSPVDVFLNRDRIVVIQRADLTTIAATGTGASALHHTRCSSGHRMAAGPIEDQDSYGAQSTSGLRNIWNAVFLPSQVPALGTSVLCTAAVESVRDDR